MEQEFASIWKQMTAEMSTSGKSFEDEDTTEDKARAEYLGIAERRVRLGSLGNVALDPPSGAFHECVPLEGLGGHHD